MHNKSNLLSPKCPAVSSYHTGLLNEINTELNTQKKL